MRNVRGHVEGERTHHATHTLTLSLAGRGHVEGERARGTRCQVAPALIYYSTREPHGPYGSDHSRRTEAP